MNLLLMLAVTVVVLLAGGLLVGEMERRMENRP